MTVSDDINANQSIKKQFYETEVVYDTDKLAMTSIILKN